MSATTPDYDPEAYSGSWSDWIAPPRVPRAAARPVVEEYFDEDDYYDEDDPPPRNPGNPGSPGNPGNQRGRRGLPSHWLVPLLAVLAVLAVTAAVGVQIARLTGSDSGPRKPLAAPPSVAAAPVTTGAPATTDQPAAAGNPDVCPNETRDGNVRGNGPGGFGSGPDAILALQNRYYVDRSGPAVHEMYAADAAAPTVEQIQAGIDSIPAGTTYCVQIMPGPFDGQHIMIVTETHPDTTRRTWTPQLVITTKNGDRTLISAIVPVPDGGKPR
ncbi:hypothetical protein ACIP5Y_31980 [Nocardia sp. NPDC088792]|uniref:hypothetical protein n=1 Tax=Nocardia sp. NPDC088792 TaxID=3364332 RepID=UPI0038165C4E